MRPLLVLMALLALVGCAGLGPDGPAPVDYRFISLRHPESGETVSGAYIHDGHYDRGILRQIDHLCRDRHNGAVKAIDPKLIDFVAELRDKSGLPETVTLDILSCYRSPETNAQMARRDRNVARESWHTRGRAIDLRVSALAGMAMAAVAQTMQRGGVAWYSKSGHVHIDTGAVRTWAAR